ncbi:MAG: response regulator transcription factor [Bacteroidetes bacterium]|nr:response regulator transcription factor [Bacteroidota bacterium]
MKIKCIIVDDEALARKGLEKYVKEIDFLELKGTCKNALEANSLINQEKIDLLFLDIEMPMLSGIDFLKSLKHSPKVIFTTAYSEYAIDSFEFDVIDYLVKPISFERFLQASNKAYRSMSNSNSPDSLEVEKKEKEFIFIKTDKQLVKVFLHEILFVQAMQNYSRVTTSDTSLLTLIPLKKVNDFLPETDFTQVHKSYIISRSKIDAIVGNQIIIGDYKIPIARSMREEVIGQLVGKRILKK